MSLLRDIESVRSASDDGRVYQRVTYGDGVTVTTVWRQGRVRRTAAARTRRESARLAAQECRPVETDLEHARRLA